MKKLIFGLIFLGLLAGTGIMQTHLKNNPQIAMLVFGAITLVSFFTQKKNISTILFFALLGTMLFVNYCILTDRIIDLINPNRGWIEFEGKKQKVMDLSWIWSVISGLFFSPLTLFLYQKKKMRNRAMEIAVTILFLVTTFAVYIIYEMHLF